MSILISASVVGANCLYDSDNSLLSKVLKLVTCEAMVTICAQQPDDLSKSRWPAEMIAGSGEDVPDGRAKILIRGGLDVTQQFVGGAREAIEISRLREARKGVLKQDSPTSGCGQISQGAGWLRAMA
jgi:uncharacterized protein YbbK (DUF523 family)